jgi:thiamine biosynthesis lipoprotein ApbE
MKAIARTVSFVAAALIIAAVPVLAEEGIMGQQEQQVQRSECLLVAKNCPTDSIQERIQRIQDEIAKGTTVYSNDELQRLNRQLEEAQKFLDYELTNGGV